MVFKWATYLDVADSFLKSGVEHEKSRSEAEAAKEYERADAEAQMADAFFRSAISRAYYAAFHAAEKYVPNVPDGEGSHAFVWDGCRKLAPGGAGIASAGDGLRKLRKKADYRSGESEKLKFKNADAAIKSARNLIDRLKLVK